MKTIAISTDEQAASIANGQNKYAKLVKALEKSGLLDIELIKYGGCYRPAHQ